MMFWFSSRLDYPCWSQPAQSSVSIDRSRGFSVRSISLVTLSLFVIRYSVACCWACWNAILRYKVCEYPGFLFVVWLVFDWSAYLSEVRAIFPFWLSLWLAKQVAYLLLEYEEDSVYWSFIHSVTAFFLVDILYEVVSSWDPKQLVLVIFLPWGSFVFQFNLNILRKNQFMQLADFP